MKNKKWSGTVADRKPKEQTYFPSLSTTSTPKKHPGSHIKTEKVVKVQGIREKDIFDVKKFIPT